MIKEEYIWEEVSKYFEENTTVVFSGISNDDRSNYFRNQFIQWDCILVEIILTSNLKNITICISKRNVSLNTIRCELVTGLREVLTNLFKNFQSVILDITSLQQPVLMYLSKLLFTDFKPLKLFATYAEPKDYLKNELGEYLSSEEYLGIKSLPGFTYRNRGKRIKLVSMLGFDGDRLMKIIEETQDIETIFPVIGFPSFKPNSQNQALKSSIRVIEYTLGELMKCSASSVFEAYELLTDLQPKDGEAYALAPLGTKPHSLACAIYATKNKGTLILYDYPKEVATYSEGVTNKICYNLTSLL